MLRKHFVWGSPLVVLGLVVMPSRGARADGFFTPWGSASQASSGSLFDPSSDSAGSFVDGYNFAPPSGRFAPDPSQGYELTDNGEVGDPNQGPPGSDSQPATPLMTDPNAMGQTAPTCGSCSTNCGSCSGQVPTTSCGFGCGGGCGGCGGCGG
jgi:hypothetical protein